MRTGRTGSPTGRTIQRHEYRNEWLEVETFVEANREHPAVIAAQEFIKSWIDAAILRRTVPGRAHLIHLHDLGVTPLQIVHEILAISLFSYRRQDKLPFGEPFRVALAYAVIRLAKPLKRTKYDSATDTSHTYAASFSGGLRRKIGSFLRENLWAFISNAVTAMQETAANHEKLVERISTSFKQPSAGEGKESTDGR
jgi:hypothetical protein